jgi:hypothetical protein
MDRFDRRRFVGRAAGVTLLGGSVPPLLAACGGGGEEAAVLGRTAEGRAVVGDVLDFALSSDEWEGDFGFVTLRLHAGIVDGREVFFDVAVERTEIVLNAALVKWSSGELAVDTERKEYLGPGQLLEPPDTSAMRVMFKLNQCFPGSRYIVTDHSIEPAAAMTSTVFAPRLQGGPREAGATGRTNVFLNGIPGPGPMGFQPSAFDSDAGDPDWSPYWNHFSYEWKDGVEPRVLKSEKAVHKARDAGELREFPGTPDTKGEVFTVNCPVPVLAPVTFRA